MRLFNNRLTLPSLQKISTLIPGSLDPPKTRVTQLPDDFFDVGSHDVVHHQLLLRSDARVRPTISQHPPFPKIVRRFDILNVRLLDSIVLEGSVERYRGLARRYRVVQWVTGVDKKTRCWGLADCR